MYVSFLVLLTYIHLHSDRFHKDIFIKIYLVLWLSSFFLFFSLDWNPLNRLASLASEPKGFISLYLPRAGITSAGYHIWMFFKTWILGINFRSLQWIYELKYCSSLFHWNFDGSFIESIDHFWPYRHFHHIDSADSQTWEIFPFIHVLFNFLLWGFKFFIVEVFLFLDLF